MQYRKIVNKDVMKEAIKVGIGKVADIVARTLGPGGLPIILERTGQALNGEPLSPIITKDGVSVAEMCQDEDENVDLIIQSVKDICKKTNRLAGDGTTTSIVLGRAILEAAFKEMEADKTLNPQLVRESVEAAGRRVLERLQDFASPVEDTKTIAEIATISANGDTEVGELIKEAFDKVGQDGVITVDEGKSTKNTITVIEGYQFKRGAEAQSRFFNNRENNKFEAENCHVILYNGNLMSSTQLVPAFEAIANNNKGFPPVLVVADEFSQEVIMWLLIQRAEAGLSVCAVRSPHVTTVRTDTMDDLAVITGGERLGLGTRNLETATYDDIGVVGKVVVDKYTTTFYNGMGDEDKIIERIEQLKAQKEVAETVYDQQVIADRIAAMANGIALIGVGGSTDFEVKERYHRIEDALNAARAAMEEGFIPGGGIVLAQIAKELEKDKNDLGAQILAKALKSPFLQISENIGEDGNENLEKVLKKLKKNKHLTYNARTKRIENALESGIIDPLKVCKTALENSLSIAALLSTCGGGVVISRKKN